MMQAIGLTSINCFIIINPKYSQFNNPAIAAIISPSFIPLSLNIELLKYICFPYQLEFKASLVSL